MNRQKKKISETPIQCNMANNLLKKLGDYNSSGQNDNAPSVVGNSSRQRSKRNKKIQLGLYDAVDVMWDGVKYPGYIMKVMADGSRFDVFMPAGTGYQDSVAAVDRKQVTARKGPKYDASKYVVEIEDDAKPPTTPKTAKKMKLEKKRKRNEKVSSSSKSKKMKKEKSVLAIERQFLKFYRTNGNVKNKFLERGNGNNNPQNNQELDNYLRDLRQRMEHAKNNEVICACDSCNTERALVLQAAASEAEIQIKSKNEVKSEGSKNEVSKGSKNEVDSEVSTPMAMVPAIIDPSTAAANDAIEEALVKEELDSGRSREFAKIRNRILFKRFDDIGAGLSSGYQNTFELMKSPGHVYGLYNLCQNSGWSPDAPILPGRSGAISGTPASYNRDGTFHYFQKREKLSRHGSIGTMWEYMGRYKISQDSLKSYGSSKCLTEQNKRIVKASIEKRNTWRQEPRWIRRCIKYNCTMDEVLDVALADPEWWEMDNVEYVDYDEDLYRYLVFWQRERGHLKGHEFKKTIAGSFIQENWSQYPVLEEN